MRRSKPPTFPSPLLSLQNNTNPIPTTQLSLNLTYTIPQTITLIRGRNIVLPLRQFDLGPILGPFCNAFATAWVSLYVVLFCFPIFLPVTVDTMNYVVVVMAGTVLWVVVMWWLPKGWGGKRKVFTGPDVGAGREGLELLSAVNAGEAVRGGALGPEMGVVGEKGA